MLIIQESREGLYRYTINTDNPTHRAWLRYAINTPQILEIERYLTYNRVEIKTPKELETLLATEQNKRIEEKGDPDYIAIGGYMYHRKYERFVNKIPKYLQNVEWAMVHYKDKGRGYAHKADENRIVYYF